MYVYIFNNSFLTLSLKLKLLFFVQPVLLPKLPTHLQQQHQQQLRGAVVGSSTVLKQVSVKVTKPNGAANPTQTKFIITSSASSMPSKNNPSPIGTSQNPIQLIQEGSTLRSLHPLTNTQVTQIAKALKEKTQRDAPSAVVCENGPNSTR